MSSSPPSSLLLSPMYSIETATCWDLVLDFLDPSDVVALWKLPDPEQCFQAWKKDFCPKHGTKLKVLIETDLTYLDDDDDDLISSNPVVVETTTKQKICVQCQLSACAGRCDGCHHWETQSLLEECDMCQQKYCNNDPCDGLFGDNNPYWHEPFCYESDCSFKFDCCLKKVQVLCYESDSDSDGNNHMGYPGCERHPQLCANCTGGTSYRCDCCGKEQENRYFYESHSYNPKGLYFCKHCADSQNSHCFKKDTISGRCLY